MNCKGEFIFRGVEKKEAGSFIDDNGKEVKYSSSYQVKLDETVEGKAVERKFKFPLTEDNLYRDFAILDIYTPVSVSFDMNIYATNVKLIPKEVSVINYDKK